MAPQSTALAPSAEHAECPAESLDSVVTTSNAPTPASSITSPKPEWFGYITPNWFASVMGTGIIATAAVTLPIQVPGQRLAATIVWAVATLMLVVISAATAVHWLKHPRIARSHLSNPIMAHFYGAPPMALMTVGAGTLLLGADVLGDHFALVMSAILWSLGTVLGLIFAVAVPCVQFVRHKVELRDAFGGWLMPVVSPMVTASTSALFIPHLPEGQARLGMMLFGYSMFGLSLFASLLICPIIWGKLALHGVGKPAMVPTLWLLLGPMGQSITAVNLLASNATYAVDADLARSLEIFGIIYGVAMLGMAGLWGVIALVLTLRTARLGLPFSLTWWSFTFPVGTCVTGLSGLALHTGLGAFKALAVIVYLALVAIWLVVWSRSFWGALVRRDLLAAPAA